MAMTDFSAQNARYHRPVTRAISLARMIDVWRSRRALARLDTNRLNDIGLTAKRAAAEEARPIWDVPTTWRD